MGAEAAVLAVHGGAGTFATLDAEELAGARRALAAALTAGWAALDGGGSALDAAVAAVRVLEDAEELNAGRGSVLNAAGAVETDAAVADGATGRAGAVAAVSGVRNPVDLARAVLADGRHVLVCGPPAADLAARHGLALETSQYFVTERRRREANGAAAAGGSGGTVGAVARDAAGDVAAATSTGGMAGKAPGRIGDSPIPGAGTWADNATCAVSATGDGEAFLLAAFAHEVDARMRLTGAGLAEACGAALEAVRRKGGTGGAIALTADGRLVMPFTALGMLRGWIGADGVPQVPASPFAEQHLLGGDRTDEAKWGCSVDASICPEAP
jgi:beta-aspartyl-peptidase (threonine type)